MFERLIKTWTSKEDCSKFLSNVVVLVFLTFSPNLLLSSRDPDSLRFGISCSVVHCLFHRKTGSWLWTLNEQKSVNSGVRILYLVKIIVMSSAITQNSTIRLLYHIQPRLDQHDILISLNISFMHTHSTCCSFAQCFGCFILSRAPHPHQTL